MLSSSWACQELIIYSREMGNRKNQKQPAQQSRANDQDAKSIELMNTDSSFKHMGIIKLRKLHSVGCCIVWATAHLTWSPVQRVQDNWLTLVHSGYSHHLSGGYQVVFQVSLLVSQLKHFHRFLWGLSYSCQ